MASDCSVTKNDDAEENAISGGRRYIYQDRCTICNGSVQLTKAKLLRVHGPISDRCPARVRASLLAGVEN